MTTETIVVTDAGFAPADPAERFVTAETLAETAREIVKLDLAPDASVEELAPHFDRIGVIRIAFPSFSDGRGFTLARDLRRLGFGGRVRAAGHVISDQYGLARRCGFDEVEIPADLARRQPEPFWDRAARPGYLDLLRQPR